MSFDYIRKTYGVPVKRGARVEYTASGTSRLGTVTSASGAHVNIRLDGSDHAMPFHPTWGIRYLDAPTPTESGEDCGELAVRNIARSDVQVGVGRSTATRHRLRYPRCCFKEDGRKRTFPFNS